MTEFKSNLLLLELKFVEYFFRVLIFSQRKSFVFSLLRFKTLKFNTSPLLCIPIVVTEAGEREEHAVLN